MADNTSTVTAGPSGPVDRALKAAKNVIFWGGATIFSATLVAMFAGLLVNVLLRYLFSQGIPWAYEITLILFPWTVGGGLVIAACMARNIQVGLVVMLVPPAVRRGFGLAVHGVVAVVSVGVVWTSEPILNASKFMKLAETGVSQFYGMLGLVVAFGLLAVVSLIDVLQILRGAGYLSHGVDTSSMG